MSNPTLKMNAENHKKSIEIWRMLSCNMIEIIMGVAMFFLNIQFVTQSYREKIVLESGKILTMTVPGTETKLPVTYGLISAFALLICVLACLAYALWEFKTRKDATWHVAGEHILAAFVVVTAAFTTSMVMSSITDQFPSPAQAAITETHHESLKMLCSHTHTHTHTRMQIHGLHTVPFTFCLLTAARDEHGKNVLPTMAR